MSLIVEDGTIVVGAESYATVAQANAYHLARGNTAWELLDDVDAKEPALRKATDYMVRMYRARWKGYRTSSVQPLDWPRMNVVLDDGPYAYGYATVVENNVVPKEVRDACAEFALRSTVAALAPDLERAASAETVGPISVTYDQNSPESVRYRELDALLAPLLKGSPMNMKLVRS
jgi:hypothetical protein